MNVCDWNEVNDKCEKYDGYISINNEGELQCQKIADLTESKRKEKFREFVLDESNTLNDSTIESAIKYTKRFTKNTKTKSRTKIEEVMQVF